MENETVRWRRLERLHLRLLNIFARVFGLLAVVVATGFTAWAIYSFVQPDAVAEDMLTLTGHASIDFLGVGIFCFVLAILFLKVRPYRPDLSRAGDNDGKREHTWWTGEPR